MHTESNNFQDYLKKNEVTDYDHKLIIDKCRELEKDTEDKISLIKRIYAFVQDEIRHSGDIGEIRVTCKSSEVSEFGHGIVVLKLICLQPC